MPQPPPPGERDRPLHLAKDKARAGSTPHIVRYVLIVSTALAIVALSLVWWLAG